MMFKIKHKLGGMKKKAQERLKMRKNKQKRE